MKSFATAAAVLVLACACATSPPDHFYILSAQPPGSSGGRAQPSRQATLMVTLPSLVDRPQMVLNTSPEAVTVLEHERWAAPLTDLVTQTLSQDIERRRGDVSIGTRLRGTTIKINVDIVEVTMRKGGRASIQAYWRIVDMGSNTETTGGDIFSASVGPADYGAAAQALSGCLAGLAERLASELPGLR